MQLTRTPDVDVPPRRFLPAEFDPADPGALTAAVGRLLERPIEDPDALREWVRDWGEVGSAFYAELYRRLIAMNRNTEDPALKERYLGYERDVRAVYGKLEDQLNRRYLACPARSALGPEFEVFDREKEQEAAIFREENVVLGVEANRKAAEWQEVQGAQQIEFRGETLTPPQLAVHLQAADRATREEAFRAGAARALRDRERIDGILDELVRLRHAMAVNAGFANYLEYGFARRHRFDYTPADCERYHAAVEAVVRPAIAELHAARRRRLGVDDLRPYDLSVSLTGRDPKPLFETEEEFVGLTRRIFAAVDPRFGKEFDILDRNGLLDLMSRPGKAPGGYNCGIEDIRLPFIFYNAVGNRRDLRVLLHEGGHAFHTLAVRGHDVLDYRHAPAEFSEVASMAMEFFGLEKLETAVDADEAREIRITQHEHGLSGLAQVALIDAFQTWFYRNPGHTRAERDDQWVALHERFFPPVDWTGLDDERRASWQRIPHFFTHPLYYIEYGIAQIGALQLWKRARADPAAAVEGYRRALALGGSRPLPELFETAGARFAMDESILRELVPEVRAALAEALDGAA